MANHFMILSSLSFHFHIMLLPLTYIISIPINKYSLISDKWERSRREGGEWVWCCYNHYTTFYTYCWTIGWCYHHFFHFHIILSSHIYTILRIDKYYINNIDLRQGRRVSSILLWALYFFLYIAEPLDDVVTLFSHFILFKQGQTLSLN